MKNNLLFIVIAILAVYFLWKSNKNKMSVNGGDIVKDCSSAYLDPTTGIINFAPCR